MPYRERPRAAAGVRGAERRTVLRVTRTRACDAALGRTAQVVSDDAQLELRSWSSSAVA